MDHKWNVHPKPDTVDIRDKLVQISDSIWYSTDLITGESAMVEYCVKTNKVLQIIEYPHELNTSDSHYLCVVGNIVYIIDGTIIAFDPSSATFATKIEFDKYGEYCSAVAMNNDIYIYCKSTAHIYNTITNKIGQINDKFASNKLQNVCSLNYGRTLIRFGGGTGYFKLESAFLTGINNIDMVYGYVHHNERKLKLNNIASDVIDLIYNFYCGVTEYNWTQIDEFTLPHNIYGCGYIIYKQFILIFGGFIGSYTNSIYFLNLKDDDSKWLRAEMKCPKKSEYRAILTSNNDVHLFQTSDQTGHYSIPLSAILPNID